MRTIVRRVGRLHRLAIFESAARVGSFSGAARELGMTQPAVTRHLRSLERSVGHDLFIRSSNRSRLSEAGNRLHRAIAIGFDVIEDGLNAIDNSAEVFVLATGPGVAQQLLVPILDNLQEAIGGAGLRLLLYDSDSELPESGFDVAARVGSGQWGELGSELLFPEVVVPVACPPLAGARGLGPWSTPSDLYGVPLVHMDEGDRQWMSWRSWFDACGVAQPAGSRRVVLNNYPLVLQQALAGKGVALGWRYLIDDLLDAGLLVEVGPEVATPNGFYLTWSASVSKARSLRLAASIKESVL